MSHIASFLGLAFQQSSLPDTGKFAVWTPEHFMSGWWSLVRVPAGCWWAVLLLTCGAPVCRLHAWSTGLLVLCPGPRLVRYDWWFLRYDRCFLQTPLLDVARLAAGRSLLCLGCGLLHVLGCCWRRYRARIRVYLWCSC